MSTLTQLSDSDLDAVTGGGFSVFKITDIAKNINVTNQSQVNIGVLQYGVSQGGSQTNSTGQWASA